MLIECSLRTGLLDLVECLPEKISVELGVVHAVLRLARNWDGSDELASIPIIDLDYDFTVVVNCHPSPCLEFVDQQFQFFWELILHEFDPASSVRL